MQHYQSLDGISLKDVWLTIGSFDGVHRGHQAIIKSMTSGAHAAGVPAVVLTFHPHPAVVLRNRQGPYYLTPPEERAALLGGLGVDVVITHPFNREVANLSAYEFMDSLHRHLGIKHLCVGHDFALGRRREGDLPTLERLGKEFGYSLDVFPPVMINGQVISSSQVRAALMEGNLEQANWLLGRPYQICGEVVHGDGRGHALGFPTANLEVWAERMLPQAGVYAGLAQVDGKSWKAVTNVGVRPTFENQLPFPQVETHLLEYDRDLYHQEISLSFMARLRDEKRFPNIQVLVDQIRLDIESARIILGDSAHG
jgi:riboflavin kinase/FMN adenylyltransferase